MTCRIIHHPPYTYDLIVGGRYIGQVHHANDTALPMVDPLNARRYLGTYRGMSLDEALSALASWDAGREG